MQTTNDNKTKEENGKQHKKNANPIKKNNQLQEGKNTK